MTLKTFIRASFVCAIASLVTYGQFPSESSAKAASQEIPRKSVTENDRTGDRMPKYTVVNQFFSVLSACQISGEGYWRRMMRRFDVDPGSETEKAIEVALAAAVTVRNRPIDLRPYLDEPPEAIREMRRRAVRRKVHELSRIYYGMRRKMKEGGASTAALDEYLETKIRPTILMVSFPNPDDDILEVLEEFETVGH